MSSSTPNRLLVIKLGSIGDVIHTLPSLASLKRAFPDAEVDWLVEKKPGIVLERNSLVHELIEVDTHRWRKRWWTLETLRELRGAIRKLRAKKYDVAIDFQGLWKSAAFGYFAAPRQLVGFSGGALKEPGCRMFYTRRVSPSAESTHVVEKNLDLVRSLGISSAVYDFELKVPEESERYISEQLDVRGIQKFIILNPGGGWVTKNWLPENYSGLHDKLHQSFEFDSVLTWGPGEEPLIERVLKHCHGKPPALIPTTIPQLIALIRKAILFVGGDTGPLHIAAACGTPVVGIYGPTDPSRNGPFGQVDWVVWETVPCGPCYQRTCEKYQQECLNRLHVDRVFDIVAHRIRSGSRQEVC